MKKLLFLILLASVGYINSFAQTTIFVDSAATGLNNGTSWTNAYNSLSDALHYCWQTPVVDSVLVAKGTYQPGHKAYNMQANRTGIESAVGDTVLHVRTGLVLQGGFATGGIGAWDPDNNLTTIIGPNTRGTIMYIDSTTYWAAANDTTVVTGFYFDWSATNTFNAPMGINVNGSNCTFGRQSSTIQVCTGTTRLHRCKNAYTDIRSAFIDIDSCEYKGMQPWYFSGAVLIGNSNGQIRNCHFEKNLAEGAASLAVGVGANQVFRIQNNQFINDSAFGINGPGSVGLFSAGKIYFEDNLFYNCQTKGTHINPKAGALRVGGNIEINNNRFIKCKASRGGALYIDNGNVVLNKNLFDSCITSYWAGAAIYAAPTVDSLILFNNIFTRSVGRSIECEAANILAVNNTFRQNANNMPFWGEPVLGINTLNSIQLINNIFNNPSPNNNSVLDIINNSTANFTSIRNNIFSDSMSTTLNNTSRIVDVYPNMNLVTNQIGFIDTTNLKGPDGIWMTADDGLNLSTTSLAVNAGYNAAVPSNLSTDIKGDNRIYGGLVDIGAYEIQSLFASPIITAGPAATSSIQQFTATPCFSIPTTRVGLNTLPQSAIPSAVVNPGSIPCTYNAGDTTFSFSTPAVGTYTLSVFFDFGTDTTQTDTTFNVVQAANVVLSISAVGGDTICAGDTLLVNATVVGNTAPVNYQWTVNGNNVGANSASYAHINGANNDIISCHILPNSSCVLPSSVMSDSLVLTVLAAPNLSVSTNGIFSYPPNSYRGCTGRPITLTGTGAGTINWSGGVNNGVPFTPTTSGNYIRTITLTGTNGCVTDSVINIFVLPTPNAAITSVPANATVCPGGQVTLTGSPNLYSPTWSGGISNGVPFTPTSTGTYTFTVNNGGCIDSASKLVIVHQLPTITVTVSPNDTLCEGASVTYMASGALTHSWLYGVGNGIPFFVNGPTANTVTATDSNGCVQQVSQSITALPNPTFSVLRSPNVTRLCDGDTINLLAYNTSTPLSYAWNNGISNGVGFTPPLGYNNYIATATDTNGCTSTMSATVQPEGGASILITISPNDTLCSGESVTLTSSGGNVGMYNYSWSGGVTSGLPFTPSASNNYVVTATYSNLGLTCIKKDTVDIVVNALPTVTANASSNPVCLGDSVLLYGSGAHTYTWTGGITDSQYFAPVTNQNFTVTGTDSNNCAATDSLSLTIDSLQTPSIGLISSPSPAITAQLVQFTAVVPNGINNYQIEWYVNGVLNTTTNSPLINFSYTAALSTDSVYCILRPIGCFAPDSAISKKIGFTFPIGITETANVGSILLYPNPTNNELIIASQKDENKIQEVTVCDMVGKILLKENYTASKEVKLSLAHLANGQYHVLIKTTDGNAIRKVQVLR